MSSEGLPLRMDVRDGHTSNSPETPGAIAECVARGCDGVRGIVADSKAYWKRTLGLCLEQRVLPTRARASRFSMAYRHP
jgi:hypothetical protein